MVHSQVQEGKQIFLCSVLLASCFLSLSQYVSWGRRIWR